MKIGKNSKIMVLTEKQEYFIECFLKTNDHTEAYKEAYKKFSPNQPIPNKASLQSSGGRYKADLKNIIEERAKENYYTKKEQALDKISAVIEKKEELQKKIKVGEVAYDTEAVNDLSVVAKNPVLFGELMRTGAVNLLFDEIELGTLNGKKIIKKAIPNEYNWLKYDKLVLTLIEATNLSKEMFKYASEKDNKPAPSVANQVNVSINK